jgi:hypothetical protein
VRTSTLVGGIDIMAQAISLAKRPHVLVGTPGRVADHLTNTKARAFHCSARHCSASDATPRVSVGECRGSACGSCSTWCLMRQTAF